MYVICDTVYNILNNSCKGLADTGAVLAQSHKEWECDSEMLVRALPFLLWLFYGVKSASRDFLMGTRQTKVREAKKWFPCSKRVRHKTIMYREWNLCNSHMSLRDTYRFLF